MKRGYWRGTPLQSRSEVILRNIVVVALTVFFVTFFIYPIFSVLLGSFHKWNPLKGTYKFNGFDNWKKVFTSDLFWLSMKNTVLFASVATFFRIILGLALATALFSKLTKHKALYRVLYYLPTITPLVAVTFVWKFIFDPQIGLLNQFLGFDINWLYDSRFAMIAILILTIWKDFGYAVIIFLGAMCALPQDCFEAAEVDGATSWNRFTKITLPLLKPTVLFIVITSLISYFQSYIPVMVLTQGGPGTVTYLAPYLIFNEAFSKYNFGYASALSFVLFLFIAVLTAISFRVSGGTGIEE